MAVTASPVTTADELLRMPDDGLRHELVRGELRTMTPPGFDHGRVAATVGVLLGVHARQTGSGVAAGTVAVLVLDPPRRTATVYRGKGDAHVHSVEETLDLSDAVPGFSVAVAELFA